MHSIMRLVLAALIGSLTIVPAGAQSSATLAIGLTGPLSGGAAQYGADVQRGIQMAMDEVNAAGGVTVGGKKMQLRLVALDDQYRPNEAATNAKRLAQQENAPIVFCPHSGGILAIQGFNDKAAPKFILAGYTSEPAVLKMGDSLFMMSPPSYDEYFAPFVSNLMKRFGKKLGLLGTTTAYGSAWAKGFSSAWTAAGGTVLSNSGIDYNTTTDFAGPVAKAIAEKPDTLLVGGPSQPTALVIKTARDQGYNGGFAVMDQAKFEQMQAIVPLARLDGAMGTAPFFENQGPGLKTFTDAYAKKYGGDRPPVSEIGINYISMHVLADAITLANSSDPVAIMAKVHEAAQKLPGKYQPLAVKGLGKTGHLMIESFAARIDNGKYVRVPLTFTE